MSRRILRRAALSGSLASLTSTGTLLVAGIHDCGSAFAPVNAVSHWIWHERALRQDSRSLRYSAVGYLIHHAASLFWAVGFETIAACAGSPETRGRALARAAGVSSLACAVDLCCIPQRLTPGFERRLSKASLVGVYVSFGLGLALRALLRDEPPRRTRRT